MVSPSEYEAPLQLRWAQGGQRGRGFPKCDDQRDRVVEAGILGARRPCDPRRFIRLALSVLAFLLTLPAALLLATE